jgi:hypothetical protein
MVTDMTGKIVLNRSKDSEGKSITVDTKNIASGIYYVQVYGDGEILGTQKIVVRRE